MSKVVQIRGVPDDVHEALVDQATAAGISLNRFVLAEFERVARRGLNESIVRRAAEREGRRLTSAQVVATLEELRSDADDRR